MRGSKNPNQRWAHRSSVRASGRDQSADEVYDPTDVDSTSLETQGVENTAALSDVYENFDNDGGVSGATDASLLNVDQKARERERDRMLYMSPIRAKAIPSMSVDDFDTLNATERTAIEKQLTRAAQAKREKRIGKGKRVNGDNDKNDDAGAEPLRRRRKILSSEARVNYDTSSLGGALSSSTRPGRDPGAATRFVEKRSDASESELQKNKKTLFGVFGEAEMKEVLQLAVPALGSLLADPLMSLIDTAAVGRHGSTSLAALGPNTAVFQIVFQLFSFLSITTTGMVARACAEGDTHTVRRVLANATLLALGFGSVMCIGLNLFATDVLKVMGCSHDLVTAAAPYLKIRALAIPAVLFATSAQGGCLGQQDSKTPLRIFLIAGVFNVAGDVLLVSDASYLGITGFNLGIKGAAYATLAAQYVGAFLFFGVLSSRKMLPRKWSHWRMPNLIELKDITKISGMLLLGSLCRMGVYTMMTTTALRLGTLTMAAHQVALQIFWTLTYFVDPLFVAATSFIARDYGRRKNRVRRMSVLLMLLSLVVGVLIAGLSFVISSFGAGVFTSDLIVQNSIKKVGPLMGLAQLVSALVLVTEGVLIGCGDLRYLLNVHCLNFVVLGGVLWWVGRSSLGLNGIWAAVFLNQFLRMAQHAVHMANGGGPDLFGVKDEMTNEGHTMDGEGEGI